MGLFNVRNIIGAHFAFAAGIFLLSCPLTADQLEDQFTNIYNSAVWGRNNEGMGSSGEGSKMSTTEPYRAYLQSFLHNMNIKSVVDAGCGDWEFSQSIDWDGVDYKGYDIVKIVVERNQAKFTQPNIQFIYANFLDTDLPAADLLVCKDVLQHLSNEDIQAFLPQLSKYNYCLITNDVDMRTATSKNEPVGRGLDTYRVLDLTMPPFNVKGLSAFTYRDAGTLKQVLLIVNKKDK